MIKEVRVERFEIASRYILENLPDDEKCEECTSSMVRETTKYSLRAMEVAVEALNVPVYRCVGDCGGVWFPPEVTLDLVDQAIPILNGYGEVELVTSLNRTRQTLQEIITTTPKLQLF